MKLIDAKYEIIMFVPEIDVPRICMGYCVCYNTPMPKTFEEQCNFIRKHRNHGSQLEHSSMSVLFTINRGVANEIVRHRHIGVGQESTRYCNYSKDRFSNELVFINNTVVLNNAKAYQRWILGRQDDEDEYMELIDYGLKPDDARGCLPIDLATKILITSNYREWISIFKLRCDDKHVHHQMWEVMKPLYEEVRDALPCVFDGIEIGE